MNLKKDLWSLALIIAVFLIFYWLPVELIPFDNFVTEALALVKWYAREHVILCLVPAFFIAGAVSVFVGKNSVMKYLGREAGKIVSYGVAAVSGSILAVCSCTILPLFAGIYRMGAGLGPASAFLYSGPAINILAIILTARVLGLELGIARAVSAVLFSIVIGLLMHFIFRKDDTEELHGMASLPDSTPERSPGQTVFHFALMIAILVFANWGKPAAETGLWYQIYNVKWIIVSSAAVAFSIILILWYNIEWIKLLLVSLPAIVLALTVPDIPLIAFAAGALGLFVLTASSGGESREWFEATWDLAKQILPLLFVGVLIAGGLLGRPGGEGLIPSRWITAAVGGNSLGANLFASAAGALMYFATLTEVPILEGLIAGGMGKGPALALLLAGPALSLPNMLVIRSVMGTRKTVTFVSLVVVMATISGMIYGALF